MTPDVRALRVSGAFSAHVEAGGEPQLEEAPDTNAGGFVGVCHHRPEGRAMIVEIAAGLDRLDRAFFEDEESAWFVGKS